MNLVFYKIDVDPVLQYSITTQSGSISGTAELMLWFYWRLDSIQVLICDQYEQNSLYSLVSEVYDGIKIIIHVLSSTLVMVSIPDRSRHPSKKMLKR